MLGHASAAMTFDTWPDLFDDDLQAVPDAEDALRDPAAGIGKPEALRHVLQGAWSRRITEKHRLVSLVDGEIAVHVFHDDADSLRTGTRVAQRVGERRVEVEVFCFGPAQRQLPDTDSEAGAVFNRQIDALVASGVRVGACVNSARAEGTEAALRARGMVLSVARDEFVRFALGVPPS